MVYKLSATLNFHSSDVRAISSPTSEIVLSASRDSTAVYWKKSASDASFAPASIFKPSERYINAVAYLPPSAENPSGYAVTGGQDAVINLFSLEDGQSEPVYSLIGHSENVCCLDVGQDGTIVSGSWDRTAKVWKNFQLVHDLKGHQQSVWAVLAVDSETTLTGSADKTIKLWQQNKVTRSFQGHRDAVRGLVIVPDIGFASCSNDSEVRVWTWEGDSVYTLSGHTSFVYSLGLLPTGDVVSAGEDRSVRVWKDGECSQIIVHPAISVWAVSVMPNGDIVSGCSDGVVRVFSAAEERWAAAEKLQEYEAQVASTSIASQQVGDVKKSDIAGMEALSVPGTKPGEVKMVKNEGGIIEAHQWDNAAGAWQKIGDVVDAVGQGRKQLYEGKEYDYVFDVDIQDGVPPLKLPYNVTDNPFTAAQKFLQVNELPLTYIDEVVKFIEKNTAGVNIRTGSEYVDPYTGASSYRSTGSSQGGQQTGGYVDPYTGASRYAPQATPSQQDFQSYSDPFTGSGSYRSTSQPAQPAKPTSSGFSTIPVTQPVRFAQANVEAMQNKIFQLSDSLGQSGLNPGEKEALQTIFSFVSQAASSPSATQSNALLSSTVEVVLVLLERWPSANRFPLLDLSRLLFAYSPSTFSDVSFLDRFTSGLFTASDSDSGKAKETNILLLLRAMANALHTGLTAAHNSWLTQVLQQVEKLNYADLNKNQRTAYASVLFNFSCALVSGLKTNEQAFTYHLSMLLEAISGERVDSEPGYRSLVALGNTVYSKQSQATLSSQAPIFRSALLSLASTFPEDRVRMVVNEIVGNL